MKISFFVRIILAVLLIVSLSSLASAECKSEDGCTFYPLAKNTPYDTTMPEIHVSFHELPVTISPNFELRNYDQNYPVGIEILSYDGDNGKKINFTFKPTEHLDNDLHQFFFEATDADENIIQTLVNFTVKVDSIDVWVKSPAPRLIEHPKIAVSTTPVFDFELELQRPGSCKFRITPWPNAADVTEFANLYANSPSGGIFQAVPNSDPPTAKISNFDYRKYFGTQNPFNGEVNGNFPKLYLLCKETNQERYSSITLEVGVDQSAPIIDPLTATPQTVVNFEDRNTSLSYSLDDHSVCIVESSTTPSDGLTPEFYGYGSFKNSYDKNQYTTEKQNAVFFRSPKTPYDYKLDVTCENLANQKSTKSITVPLKLVYQNEIKFISPEKNTNKASGVELVISASLGGECYQSVNKPDEVTTKMNKGDGFNEYKSTISLAQGMNKIYVKCGIMLEPEIYEVYVDSEKPTGVTIDSLETTCSLTNYEFSIDGGEDTEDGSGFDHYVWSVSSGDFSDTGETSNKLVTVNIAGVTQGSTLKVEVYSVDKAGNEGPIKTESVKVSDDSAIECDVDPPIDGVTTEATSNGYEVTVTCRDPDGSGCTDSFKYKTIDIEDECEFISGMQTKTYASQPIIFSENVRLCYEIQDKAGNKKTGTRAIEATLEMDLVNPRMGISDSKNFKFELETNRPAECRHGYLSQSHPEDLEQWFNTLSPFDTNDDTTHSSNINACSIFQLKGCSNEESAPWVIICNEEGLYHVKSMNAFGYDLTEPAITVKATPNPVIDPGNMISTLEVTSDDPVVCTYLNKERIGVGFPDYDVNVWDSYKTKHSVEISYWGETENDEQLIKCRNLAQANAEKTYIVKVEPDNSIRITVNNKKYSNKKSITLNVSTAQIADCKYRTSVDGDYQDFKTTGTYEHKEPAVLAEGTNNVEVFCTARGSGDEGVVFKEIIVDTKNPTVEVLSADNTCSLTKLSAEFVADGTGSPIEKFEYVLSKDGQEIDSAETTNTHFESSMTMKEGEKYKLDVTTYDEAGNKAFTSKIMTATTFNANICDIQPPSGDAVIKYVWGGAEVNLICQDAMSGCSDTFGYNFDTEGECSDNSYKSGKYEKDLPLFATEKAYVCYKLFDKVGLSYSNKKLVNINAECFNGVEDPDEEGVDCGGTCNAQCGTCNNNKQDEFELGVDCGGVCNVFKRCYDDIPPIDDVFMEITPEGFAVTVGCRDPDGSGCTDSFRYKKVGIDDTCTFTGMSTLKYSAQPIIFDKDGQICYQISDVSGNTKDGSAVVEAKLNLQLVSPRLGVSNEKVFTLEVSSNRNVICKQGYAGINYNTPEAQFAAYRMFDNTAGRRHTTNIVAGEISQFKNYLSRDSQIYEWMVMCEEQGVYHYLPIPKFGYDTTPPDISLSLSRETITDQANMMTVLTAQTDDDVVCSYTFIDGTTGFFPDYNVTNIDSYKKQNSDTLYYWGVHEDANHTTIVTCRNLAQDYSTDNITIKIRPQDNVGITIHGEQYSNKRSQIINVSTEVGADCGFRINSSKPYISLSSNEDSTEHIKTGVSFLEGENELEVNCIAQFSLDNSTKSKTIIIDSVKPTVSVISNEISCSLDKINAEFLGNGTGTDIDYFEYNITNSTKSLKEGKNTNGILSESVNLVENASYDIKVIAYDLAGNPSTQVKKTIKATKFDSVSCDVTAPKGSASYEEVWGGVNITIECDDKEGDCDNKFGYTYDDTGDCNVTKYTEGKFDEDIPLFKDKSSTICYKVYDLAANFDVGKLDFEVVDHCFNGIEDPAEKGVDCGGPCSAECGTCKNGKQDEFEEGVDCGGVCESIKSCGEEPDNKCKIDDDCKTGFVCNALGDCVSETAGSCTTDDDCDDDYYCFDKVCTAQGGGPVDCYTKDDCEDGFVCGTSGICLPETTGDCVRDSDCTTGYSCISYVCVADEITPLGPECSVKEDCSRGKDCVNETCVDDTIDTDNDGIPDWWENENNLDPDNPADAQQDPDNDGYNNSQEYSDDTNPHNPKDYPGASQGGDEEKKANIIGVIFVILGVILILGGVGLLVYEKYKKPEDEYETGVNYSSDIGTNEEKKNEEDSAHIEYTPDEAVKRDILRERAEKKRESKRKSLFDEFSVEGSDAQSQSKTGNAIHKAPVSKTAPQITSAQTAGQNHTQQTIVHKTENDKTDNQQTQKTPETQTTYTQNKEPKLAEKKEEKSTVFDAEPKPKKVIPKLEPTEEDGYVDLAKVNAKKPKEGEGKEPDKQDEDVFSKLKKMVDKNKK